MPLQYLLDTDICIYIRGKQPKILARFAQANEGDCAISAITHGELAFGCAKSPKPEQALLELRQFVAQIPSLPLPVSAVEIYGSTRWALSRQGQLIGPNDLWIAAHAMAAGLTLVTNNEGEFSRVPGLNIENWAK